MTKRQRPRPSHVNDHHQRTLDYGARTYPYRIIETEQLNGRIRIHVDPSGDITVEAPKGSPLGSIASAVRKRAAWIARHHQQSESTSSRLSSERRLVSGSNVVYLGRNHQLKISTGAIPAAKLVNGRLEVCSEDRSHEAISTLIATWLECRATDYLSKRLALLADTVPWCKEVPPLRFLRMRRSWGTCSPKWRITLNPLLIQAPRPCIDYVILHECCHLKEHNHSPTFYRLLERLMPDWRIHKPGHYPHH